MLWTVGSIATAIEVISLPGAAGSPMPAAFFLDGRVLLHDVSFGIGRNMIN
jgi:hypothetical protein